MAEAPIGSIVAYAGPIDREEFEAANSGWMLCDGRRLNRNDPALAALFNAILFNWGGDGDARFNLPDLRGYFLRGVDVRWPEETKDPDNSRRTAIHPGGAGGASVGSEQNYATAAPTRTDTVQDTFRTRDSGTHGHFMDFQINATRDVGGTGNTVAHPAPSPTGRPSTEQSGAHSHIIEPESGNRETRPINAYVHWIIRVA